MSYEVGDRVELTSDGTIPGIPPGTYYIVAKREDGAIAVSTTLGGVPLIPTGQIIGNPKFLEKKIQLAFPLEYRGWLNTSLEKYLGLTTIDYLQTPLGY